MKYAFTIFLLLAIVISVQGQQLAYFDAAQAYNRLLIEKNNGAYIRVGNYKVIGTPFLFGERVRGNISATGETTHNIFLNYNTYNQKLEFFLSENPQVAFEKDAATVDSFEFQQNTFLGLNEGMNFINGKYAGADDKVFLRVMYSGKKYNLYKKYKSVLGVVTTNYIESELRQFDLTTEYYYYDEVTRKYKKLKASYSSIMKEFGEDVEALIDKDALVTNPDSVLLAIFTALNN